MHPTHHQAWFATLAAVTLALASLGCEATTPAPAAAQDTADALGDAAGDSAGDTAIAEVADGAISDSAACGTKPTEMCGTCDSDVVVEKQCVNGTWACPSGYVPELAKLCVYSCAGLSAPSCCTAAGATVAATCDGPGPNDWQCADGKPPLEKGNSCGADANP